LNKRFFTSVEETKTSTGNQLIAGLSADDFALLAPHLQPVSFAVGDFITRAGDPIDSFFASWSRGSRACWIHWTTIGAMLSV
jgi:hypothetical protein